MFEIDKAKFGAFVAQLRKEKGLMQKELAEKDEIGFVDKDESGRSTIFSLDSFSERFDKKVCKSYLEGKYKAIPRFKS